MSQSDELDTFLSIVHGEKIGNTTEIDMRVVRASRSIDLYMAVSGLATALAHVEVARRQFSTELEDLEKLAQDALGHVSDVLDELKNQYGLDDQAVERAYDSCYSDVLRNKLSYD